MVRLIYIPEIGRQFCVRRHVFDISGIRIRDEKAAGAAGRDHFVCLFCKSG